MNLKQIAQKLGGYIQSKTQDDKGWIRQGKFTPVQQVQQSVQNWQQKPSNQLVNRVIQSQPVQNFTTGLKQSPVFQFGQTLGKTIATPLVSKNLQQNSQQYQQNISTALKIASQAKTQEDRQKWLNLAKSSQSLLEKQSGNIQQEYNKSPIRIIGEGIGTAASLIGGPKITPKSALTMASISGGINKIGGGSFVQGAGTGLAYAPVYAGVSQATNPLLSKIVNLTPAKAQTTGRLVSGLSNVGQGIVSDISTGQKTTPLSMGIDLATGIVGGKTQFDTGVNVKGMTGKNKMTFKPKSVLKGEEIDIIDQINERLGKTKDISWEDNNFLDNVLRQRTNATQGQLDNLTAKQKLNELLTFANRSEGFKGVTMGIYGGKRAQGYKPDMKGQFSNMADKKVRFEIDDSKAKYNFDSLMDLNDIAKRKGKIVTVKDLIQHDELFKQYPEIKNMKVDISSGEGVASYHPETDSIRFYPNPTIGSPKKIQSTLLHEIQHAIQERENFAKGGNPEDMSMLYKQWDNSSRAYTLRREMDKLPENIDLNEKVNIVNKKYRELLGGNFSDDAVKLAMSKNQDEILALNKGLEKYHYNGGIKGYQRLSGEIESRDVSARMNLTPEQRARTQPYVSQGIPQNEWITKFDDNTSLSSPIKTGGDDLLNEAKKYKSAEEFVKAQQQKVTNPDNGLSFGELAKKYKLSPNEIQKAENWSGLNNTEKKVIMDKIDQLSLKNYQQNNPNAGILSETYTTKNLTDIYNQSNLSPESVSPIKTGTPESKGTIKLKDNDLVKTFDKTVKTTETPKVKVRGFTESVQETPKITKGTKVKVAGEYTTKPNDVLMGEAKALLNEGVDLKNINRIENIDQKIAATIQESINLDTAGKHNEAAALFNNLSELGTQVGRGTQAFSLLNKMSPEAISLSVAGKIKKYNLSHNKKLPELTGEQQKQLSKQVNEALKLPVGSKERGIALGKVNETINSFIPSTFADKFITVWKAGLLSSLRTHERNIVGNTLMQASEQASLYPASGADYLMSLATGKRSLVASQKGSLSGAVEGGKTAADVMKYGFDPMGTDIGKYEIRKVNWGNNPLEQSLKKATDVVFNTLEAEDKVFWKSSYNRSLYNQAITQAVNEGKRGNTKYIQKLFDNATEEMKQTAFNDANYATFKDKNMLSGAIGQYKSWVNRQTGPAAEAGKIVSEMLMPFTGVPTSIVGKTVAYSPIGLVKGSVDFGRVVAGSEVPGLQRQAAQEIGRGVIGSGIFGLGAYLMSQGLMTGQAKDQKERDQWALEGKQENSIFVNGKWRSINSVGPQTLVLLAGAKANETANDPEQNLGTYGFSTLNDQLNQTFLSGIQQPLAALNEPYKAKSYLGGQVASLVPNIVKDTSKAFDPLKREVDTSTIGSSIKGRVQQSIPGLRNKMIPQRDVLGNEIAQTPTGIGAYFDLFNSTTPISNTVVNELSRLNTAGYNKTPTKLDKNQTIGGEKMTLNQAQLDRLEIVSGLATDKALNDLFNTTAYQSLNDAEKQDAIGDTITKVRKNVRANIDLSNIQEKSYVKSSDSQLTELGGFNLFTKSVTTDPNAAMNALLTGNPIRKTTDGNIVVLERQNDVGSYDLGDTTSQVDHAIPLSLGGTNEVRNLQILSNEEHAIKTKTDMYLLDQVQSGKMPLKEAQEKAKKWRDTALSLPKDAQSQIIDEIDSESPDKQSDGSQVYKLVSDTGNVTLVDLGTPIQQPEYTGFDAIDKKLKSSYKSAITKRINNIVKLYEDGQLSAKEANKLIGELNTQYSSGTGTQKKSKKKITFKVTSPKALPKITLKISSPVSRVKLKSAPKIKLSKTDNRKYTIKA